jgi:hypothetical protein
MVSSDIQTFHLLKILYKVYKLLISFDLFNFMYFKLCIKLFNKLINQSQNDCD